MLNIGILIYPMVEELDFVGPFEVLSYINKIDPGSTKVFTVAEESDVVQCFNGLRVIPDVKINQCPQLDILVVPGGQGRKEGMYNKVLIDFINKQALNAKYITSVCTGAFLLAEAGLLKRKRATTYHQALDELEKYPDLMVKQQKVVQDDNIITSGGVSSGIELGLYLLKIIFGRELAQEVANKIEYDINVLEITG